MSSVTPPAPNLPGAETLLRAAIKYASRGLPVVPLHRTVEDGTCACGWPSCEKKDYGSPFEFGDDGADLRPSKDPDEVKEGWSRWPSAGVGLALGHGARPLVALRVKGASGVHAFERLTESFPGLALGGLVVRRGDQTWHLHFLQPHGEEYAGETLVRLERLWMLDAAGLYIETAGAVAMPPTVVDGTEVTWESPTTHAGKHEAMNLLVQHLSERKREEQPRFVLRGAHELTHLRGPDLVPGLLPGAGLGLLYGLSGAGKTFVALDLALSVATGAPWLGQPIRHGAVLWIAAEGQAGLDARVQAWCEHRRIDERPRDLQVLAQPLDLTSPDDVGAIIADVRRLDPPRRPALVVVDTLALSLGGSDENSASTMAAALKGARRLSDAFGALVLPIHHTGKDGGDARGSNALTAGAEVRLKLSPRAGKMLQPILAWEKMREGALPPKRTLELVEVAGSLAVLTEPLAAAKDSPEVAEVLDALDRLGREATKTALAGELPKGNRQARLAQVQRVLDLDGGPLRVDTEGRHPVIRLRGTSGGTP